MARKHQRRKVHYGSEHETSCGLKWPRVGAGITTNRAKVTCQACAAVLATAETAERRDPHAARIYRLAHREYRLAMGAGHVRPA